MLVDIFRIVARKSSTGGFTFVQRCLTFYKLSKTALIYSVSYFNLGGLGALFGGIKPLPVATGLNIIKFDLALLFTIDT